MNMGDESTSDPHIISNITTSYDYSPDINIYFSIRNLDDKMPQRDRSKSYPYYEQGYFSAFGRYYSAGFNYRF
jgi:outer membrane receptor protein involved in Fe transport